MLSIDDDADWVKWDVGQQRMMNKRKKQTESSNELTAARTGLAREDALCRDKWRKENYGTNWLTVCHLEKRQLKQPISVCLSLSRSLCCVCVCVCVCVLVSRCQLPKDS